MSDKTPEQSAAVPTQWVTVDLGTPFALGIATPATQENADKHGIKIGHPISLLMISHEGIAGVEGHDRARLIVAACNAFQSAAQKLGVNPVELAESVDVAGLVEALRELRAIVRGECPSLLNEDSGGDGELSLEIDDLLSKLPGKEAR